jgi:MacB-like protein
MKFQQLTYAFVAAASLFLSTLPALATSHGNGSAVIEIAAQANGGNLSETLADRLRPLPGIVRIEKYLLIPGSQVDKIGIEPGAPIRILTDDGRLIAGRVELGRDFKRTDAGKNVALVNGVSLGSGAMTGMAHSVGVGQSFLLNDRRFRVAGEVIAPTKGRAFFPLDTLQEVFGKDDLVTHFFVVVADDADANAVQQAVEGALGPTVRTTLR